MKNKHFGRGVGRLVWCWCWCCSCSCSCCCCGVVFVIDDVLEKYKPFLGVTLPPQAPCNSSLPRERFKPAPLVLFHTLWLSGAFETKVGLMTTDAPADGKDIGPHSILMDIQGTEDHYGDMDFKVAGTAEGITAIQVR